ncbi:hypothetical protein MKX07_005863 [Trichoderma sp. CBMAI-0711]|uniref:Uncharacterized protein n=1 Tax=Trichoderma parareesei TaxID=858221 RepID=A0A2H2ZPV1_TRIPA|nr:hypothetical protein MKX07_005863 [Trichoderma sp. CBMAI-0711]OTA08749.1 hypothetical protein A9Z42_0004580 [Trichoderma parareesei]
MHNAFGLGPSGRATPFQLNHDARKPLFGRPEDNAENPLHLYNTARTPGYGRIGMPDSHATGLRKPRPVSEGFASTARGDQAGANGNGNGNGNGNANNASVLSSGGGGTKIPRLNSLSQSRRKPISLRKAMELAEGEEEAAKMMLEAGMDDPVAVDGSPSPAPRPWRTRTASEVSQLQRELGADHLDTKARSKIPSARNSNLSATLVSGREGAVSPARGSSLPLRAGHAGVNREGTATTATTASSGLPSLVPGIEDIPLPSVEPALSAATLVQPSSPSPGKSFVWQMDEDFTGSDLQISDSPRVRVGTRPFASRLGFTPEAKQDFDKLPRITAPGSRNSKLDEIRSLELRANGSHIPLAGPGTRPKPQNTKLDEILKREAQVERQIPLPSRHLDGPRNNTKIDDIKQREADGMSKRAYAAVRLQEIKEQNSMARPRSPDDESKHRLPFGLARRRLAKTEVAEEVKKEEAPPPPPPPLLRPRTSFGSNEFGRPVVDKPVTIFNQDPKRAGEQEKKEGDVAAAAASSRTQELEKRLDSAEQQIEALLGKRRPLERRPDEHELLRRLARAASSSPPVDDEPRAKQLPTPPPGDDDKENKESTGKSIADRIASRLFPRRASTGEKLAPNTTWNTATTTATTTTTAWNTLANTGTTAPDATKEPEKAKPSVAFTGLQRTRSVDSTKSKRSSMQSEPDPTARIEAEMKLFAPSDNHSERGSLRAPSPPLDDSDLDDHAHPGQQPPSDATPKPSKPDPLTMATPRVTGAYVETPVSVKTEKLVLKPEPKTEDDAPKQAETKTTESKHALLFRDRKPSFTSWRSKQRNQDQDTLSDPGTTDDGGEIGASALAAVKKPRAKSLPRRRLPVKNSARPPSVKDDLMELRREYNIDDSTFDDLDEMLANARKMAKVAVSESGAAAARSKGLDLDLDLDLDFGLDSESDAAPVVKSERAKDAERTSSDGEIAAYERMNKTLQTGLLRIRSAKQGIERIEDRFSRAQPTPEKEKEKKSAALTEAPEGHAHHSHESVAADCPYCASSKPASASAPVTYLHLALPRLFHREPTFRLTWLGLFTLILSVWYATEATMCSLYCRPTSCPASKAPCVWSFDDPTEFGTALPIKLDQWITGGSGRQLASVAYEEAYDVFADIQDLVLRRSITDVDMEALSPEQKRRHRRRLRKKGLVASPKAPRPEDKAKWDEWRAARLAKERASQKKEKRSTTVEEEMPKPIPVAGDAEEGEQEQGWVKIKGWR